MKTLFAITLLLVVSMLTSCASTYPYLTMAAHDRKGDSEFEEHWWIFEAGVEHEFNKNLSVHIEHSSMPMVYEGGNGINKIGGTVKFR